MACVRKSICGVSPRIKQGYGEREKSTRTVKLARYGEWVDDAFYWRIAFAACGRRAGGLCAAAAKAHAAGRCRRRAHFRVFLRSSLEKVEMRFSLAPRAPVFAWAPSRAPPGCPGLLPPTSRGAHDDAANKELFAERSARCHHLSSCSSSLSRSASSPARGPPPPCRQSSARPLLPRR